MKRALLGTKRKKAKPARKLAAKRPVARAKSKLTKPAAKKRPAPRKPKPALTKAKVAKAKVVAKTPVKRKATRRPSVKAKKLSVRKVSSPRKPKSSVVPKRKTTKRAPVGKTVGLAGIVAVPPPPLAKPALVALVEPSPVLPKVSRKVGRKASRKTPHQPQVALPAFLLEGDEPSYPVSGAGEKFVLGPTPPLDHFDEAKVPLPDSYGTGRLFLTARDPHWLYAHWDFTMQEQFRYNAQSVDRHMVLRLHDVAQPGPHISEIHVHPESRHWFTHVDAAGEKYFAEIGYYQPGRKWKSLAISEPQRTPPDNISADSTIEFATIPVELPFETMLALLKEQSSGDAEQNLPLARGIEQIRSRAHQHFPPASSAAGWTSEQEQALAKILAADRAGVASPSSGEFIAEQSWPEFAIAHENGGDTPIAAPSSYVSSFFGGVAQKDFWFNVNAELIVYGATEPNATVTFAGQPIPLRPDGSFRFHFSLPDGQYELPVTAVSADGTDGRAAGLKFARATQISGAVDVSPVNAGLRPPSVERV